MAQAKPCHMLQLSDDRGHTVRCGFFPKVWVFVQYIRVTKYFSVAELFFPGLHALVAAAYVAK